MRCRSTMRVRYLIADAVVMTSRGSRGDLARTAAGPLAGDHHSMVEDLATPDAPRFTAFEGTGQAGGPDRALDAEHLGLFQVVGTLGEEQVGITRMTRQIVEDERFGWMFEQVHHWCLTSVRSSNGGQPNLAGPA